MKDEFKYIDELFEKQLSDIEMGAANQGWAGVSARLTKNSLINFLKSATYLKIAGSISVFGIIVSMLIISSDFDLLSDRKEEIEETEIGNLKFEIGSAKAEIEKIISEAEKEESQNLAENLETEIGNLKFEIGSVNPEIENIASEAEKEESQNLAENLETEIGNSKLVIGGAKAEIEKIASEAKKEKSKNLAENLETEIRNLKFEIGSVKPETQNSKLETQYSKLNSQNSILSTQYSKLPYLPGRGFVPLFYQTEQNNIPNLVYISPLAQNAGYNPLSWAIAAWFSPQMPNISIETNDAETKLFLPYLEAGLQNPYAYDAGLRIEAHGKNFLVETGLNFMQISQKANYSSFDFFVRDSTIWSFWDSSYVEIDTIDSYFQIIGSDTSWFYVTETNEIFLHDSSSTDITDTIHNEKIHNFANRYKYFEIPLIVGYSFRKGRLNTSLKAGIISSFLWEISGQSMAGQSENDVISLSRDDFPTVRFDIYSSLEARYSIGSRYFVFGEMFYRQSLSPIFSRNNVNYRFSSYGLKFGTGIYF